MSAFAYRGGTLYADQLAVGDIAARVGTPFYLYSADAFARRYRDFSAAFAGCDHLVCYSVKANSNQAVLRLLAGLGAGMDVVSGGELRRALSAGVAPQKIVFAGVGKTEHEHALAIAHGILCVNVESEAELAQLARVAQEKGARANAALRINPDIDAHTHEKITTGRAGDKFGIAIERAGALYAQAAAMPGLKMTGIAMHIGSQITDLGSFDAAFSRLADFHARLNAAGHAVTHLDIGGGLAVAYDGAGGPSVADYAAMARARLASTGCRLVLEPGRFIAAPAGILVTRVLYNKSGAGRHYVIVDAAMNDLVRPTLYQAVHRIDPVIQPRADAPHVTTDIAGPVCESGDFLARGHKMALPEPGDLLALRDAGAYGAVQASSYNSRLLVPEVMVRGENLAVIRPRPDYESMIAADIVPAWINT